MFLGTRVRDWSCHLVVLNLINYPVGRLDARARGGVCDFIFSLSSLLIGMCVSSYFVHYPKMIWIVDWFNDWMNHFGCSPHSLSWSPPLTHCASTIAVLFTILITVGMGDPHLLSWLRSLTHCASTITILFTKFTFPPKMEKKSWKWKWCHEVLLLLLDCSFCCIFW